MSIHKSHQVCESLQEAAKDIYPRKLSNVPGLKYVVHHVAGHKYLSLQHEKSGKYLVKSMHVGKIRDSVDLADHFFKGYDFTKHHDDLAKDASHLHGIVQSFRSEIDRIHTPPEPKPPIKKAKKK
jgi:hypothetical protein